MNTALLTFTDDADFKKRVGVEGGALTPGTPEQPTAFLRTELDSNAKMIRAAGMKRA